MKGNEMEQSIVSSPPSQDSRPMHSIEITHKVGVASGMQPRSGPTIFSSSLPVKLNFTNSEPGISSTGTTSSSSNQMHQDGDMKDSLEDVDSHAIDNLLPDDEYELLAGIIDDFDLSDLPNEVEDLEEYDLFGSGGGLELDFESPDSLSVGLAKASILDNYSGNGNSQFGLQNGLGAVAGEHPFGEHPSRTLFVRNINSNVEDSELRNLFEAYGAIRTLYTACKHRGFVMISYYDIRSARTAMRALQNKPLRRRKLDIHFSIPKDNPSDKDINQGTLVVFNLDPSVSNDDLRQIFGAYGEVKEIRETPHKRHHKFIEFYDVRAAEAALRSLNRSDIAGKRIKLEPSRPGGARRNLMQQMSQDLEADDTRSYRHPMGSPITNSPPGSWAQFSSPIDNAPLHSLSQPPSLGTFSPMTSNHMPGLASPPSLGTFSPMTSNHMPGLASILAPLVSASSSKIAPIGKEQVKVSHTDQAFSSSSSAHGTPLHSHSFPEHSSGMMPMGHSPGGVASFGPSNSSASGIGTLTGPQFLWGSPTPYSEHTQSSAWPSSSLGHSFPSNGQQSYSYSRPQSFLSSSSRPHQFHVGSAPSGVHLERHFGYFPESPETSYMSHLGFGGVGLSRNEGSMLMGIGGRVPLNSGVSGLSENGSPSFRLMPSQRLGQHMFIGGGGLYTGQLMGGGDAMVERGRTRRADTSANQIDSKKQYQLDLDKIINGEDIRTTLMIKNIPNKYTSKMLLAAIDENHRGTYDFLYLPIDFKNKCNVGYAFINMMSPNHIIPFYQAFNGKKWEKFNSEKVASLAYARIQGKAALVTHFQNSSLMNEDKRCRPILFHSEGPEAGDQEPFPLNSLNVRLRSSQDEDSVESPTKANNSVEKKS